MSRPGRLPRLMGITPGDGRGDLETRIVHAHSAGLGLLVLREPTMGADQLLGLGRRIAPLFPVGGLIIHARCAGAMSMAESAGWGVHLPASVDPATVRPRIRGVLGASCHTVLEIARARRAGCDYITLSPVWKPGSKAHDARRTLGIRGLEDACPYAGMPVFALGGVSAARISRCLVAGAHGVATISGVFAGDPEACATATRRLSNRLPPSMTPGSGALGLADEGAAGSTSAT
jgi:thiamine-phosphate pyrophosphorylase